MKKVIFLAILLSVLFAAPVLAHEDKNTRTGGGCFENGQIIFTFGGSGQKGYDVRSLTVVVQKMEGNQPAGQNITPEGWWYYSDPYREPLVWTGSSYVRYIEYPNWKNVYFDDPSSPVSVNNRVSMFASKEGYAKEPGQYRVYILNSTGGVVHTTDMACPGLKFACDLVNITIDRCYNIDGTFRVIFGVEGMKQSDLEGARELDLLKDFNYKLGGDYPHFIYTTFPKGAKLEHLGGNKYTLEVAVPFEVRNFTLETKDCKPEHPFYYEGAWETASCEPIPECRSSEDCDDGNPCTLDKCVKGICAHEDICQPPNVTETPAPPPENVTVPPKNIFQIWWEMLTEFFRIFG